MAFWRKKGGRRVFVYTYRQGKQVSLPRKLYKHLDLLSDEAIQSWVAEYEHIHEKRLRKLETTFEDVRLQALATRYVEYLDTLKERHRATISSHEYNLRICLVWFAAHYPDPEVWPYHALELYEHLKGLDRSATSIYRANIAIRGFWKWMRLSGEIKGLQNLVLHNPKMQERHTPLQYTITPEQVIGFAKDEKDNVVKLMALAGYFFSLRTQENLALHRTDFIVGKATAPLECCKVMSKYNMFDRLAVYIDKSLTPTGKLKPGTKPAAVACFNKEAAYMIVETVKLLPREGPLYGKFGADWLMKVWRLKGMPGITLKDLRRASLYWLGHYGGLDFIPLKNHARHERPETTSRYVRRPEEDKPDDAGDLEFD